MDVVIEFLLSKAPVVFVWVVTIVGVASMAAAAVAPLTKTTVDDKLAGLLSKVKALLDKLALNPKI